MLWASSQLHGLRLGSCWQWEALTRYVNQHDMCALVTRQHRKHATDCDDSLVQLTVIFALVTARSALVYDGCKTRNNMKRLDILHNTKA